MKSSRQKRQFIIGLVLVVAMLFFANYLGAREGRQKLFLITGLGLGYILSRSRYGFAGGVKRIFVTGEGSLSRALLVMFLISMIGSAGIHYGAASKGAVAAYKAVEGDMVIPGSSYVTPADLSKIIGGLIFGFGMILGGGCASGTLTDSGEGEGRAWITVLFFCIGGIIGHGLLPWWNTSGPGKVEGITLYLPDKFGYLGALALSALGILILFAIVQAYEGKRRKSGTVKEEAWEASEEVVNPAEIESLFTSKGFRKIFVERWSFLTGGVLIAMMFVFIINTTGDSWGASGPYALWGLWGLDKVGLAPKGEAFAGALKTVRGGLLNNPVSVRNIGIILGATIAMLLSGRFKFNFDFKLKDTFYYALGGISMGIGAKIAGGCNVGALYSGIGNFSLSGWLFMVSLIVGAMISLNLFEGKVNILPDRGIKK